MRPRSAIAAEPQCRPNSDSSLSADAPPLAAAASARGWSTVNRSTSQNGGDWLNTSWVANEGWVMDHSGLVRESFYAGTAAISRRLRGRSVPAIHVIFTVNQRERHGARRETAPSRAGQTGG